MSDAIQEKLVSCPACGTGMVAGIVFTSSLATGFWRFDFAAKHCVFRDGEGNEDVVVHNDWSRPAHRCPSCGTVLLAADPRLPPRREPDQESST